MGGENRMNKLIGLILLVLAAGTVVCMRIDNNSVWNVYNYIMIVMLIVSGILLIKQK